MKKTIIISIVFIILAVAIYIGYNYFSKKIIIDQIWAKYPSQAASQSKIEMMTKSMVELDIILQKGF